MTSDSWRVDRLNWNTSLPSMTPGEFEKTNWKTDERKNKLFDLRTSEEDNAFLSFHAFTNVSDGFQRSSCPFFLSITSFWHILHEYQPPIYVFCSTLLNTSGVSRSIWKALSAARLKTSLSAMRAREVRPLVSLTSTTA